MAWDVILLTLLYSKIVLYFLFAGASYDTIIIDYMLNARCSIALKSICVDLRLHECP